MITISRGEARRFLLKYQNLYPPRGLEADGQMMAFIRKIGCIQYDPLSTTARNADLVLQSRCRNYSTRTLYRLLYEDRQLLDGWDKNMSIWPIEDWPCFERRRKGYREWFAEGFEGRESMRKRILDAVRQAGYVTSREIDDGRKVDWAWGPTTLARATLESMYHLGELVVHHREGTRKYYGMAKDLVPPSIFGQPDPNRKLVDYFEWYVRRRIGSIGLLWDKPSDAWLGSRLKKAERVAAVRTLLENGEISEVQVEGFSESFYLLNRDLELLDDCRAANEASLLAPLDNLMWDRNLISRLFDFDYKWEVYTPVKKRKFGYYVLPVICGERFVGRCEPVLDSGNRKLVLMNWWWEKGIVPDQSTKDALSRCFRDFTGFLGVEKIMLSRTLSKSGLGWLKDCVKPLD